MLNELYPDKTNRNTISYKILIFSETLFFLLCLQQHFKLILCLKTLHLFDLKYIKSINIVTFFTI